MSFRFFLSSLVHVVLFVRLCRLGGLLSREEVIVALVFELFEEIFVAIHGYKASLAKSPATQTPSQMFEDDACYGSASNHQSCEATVTEFKALPSKAL